MTPDGTCPTCGLPVDGAVAESVAQGDDEVRAPWHFWLMMAAVVIYLGWRLLEAIWWAIQQVT